MKKKIVHFSSVHPALDTRIIKECKSLVTNGYEVVLIAQHHKDEIIDGVVVKALPEPQNRFERFIKLIKTVYLKALAENGAIYHFHDPELIPVGLLLIQKGKKVISDVHEDVPADIMGKDWLPYLFRSPVSKTVKIIERNACKYFNAIIAATPTIAHKFKTIGCRVENINNYPTKYELFDQPVPWTNKTNNICYVGSINRGRGIFEMINAFNKLDAELLLGGKFDDIETRMKCQKIEGWHKVVELGQVPREQFKDILMKSLAGLVIFLPEPNHISSQPNKMFEYMSAGIPVIGSNFDLWKNIIEKNNCGICVDPNDSNEIANAIQWVLDHPDKAEEMGRNGRRMIEENYNWEKEQYKLLNLYEELLA